MGFFLARQPIFDRQQMVIGYEIVYKDNEMIDKEKNFKDAASRLLLNSYLDTAMESLLDGHIAFIPFTEELILRDTPLLLNKSTTVIQIHSSTVITDLIIDKIKYFKGQGYLIALSDYSIDYNDDAMLQLSDIIQVNLKNNTLSDLKRMIRRFEYTTQILQVTNIETFESYDTIKRMGFELFEGSYFCKPTYTRGKILSQSCLNNIEILKLANEAEPDIKLISRRIEKDVNLTVKFLRLVNSSHFFMNKINSVQHALAMIGINAFRNWLNLALLDSFLTDQTPEIIKQSMVRMKLMESIGELCNREHDIDSLKLIGLLSVLDVLLDKDMMEAVNPLPIDRELKITLFGKESKYSDVFQYVLNYERGKFKEASNYAKAMNLDMNRIPQKYKDALEWADELYHLIYPDIGNQ